MASDNTRPRNKYLNPKFWTNKKHHFWLSPHHTPASREYFERFVAGQKEILNRKCK